MAERPADLYYSKEHEWVRVEGTKAYVGITDYAQESLGDVVYVELPEVGLKLAANDEAATVESVKASSSIYSPIGGVIVEVNDALNDAPNLLNEAPYENHVFVLELDGNFDSTSLLNADEYGKICE